ncbi:MAG TPA: hypothetical protein VI540_09005 [Gaiellaceae bacterium]|nr:hypothetical protein [Gaiellaceae bacterium]
MPISVPVPDKSAGDVFTETNWDAHLRDNINKLLDRGHRVLTVAQFSALTGLEDGDEAYVEVDAANGIMWHFRYVAAETTYKWRFLGGPPLWSEVVTSQATTSTSYAALATAGPSVTLPRSGDYDVEHSGSRDAAASETSFMSYDIGATGAVDADAIHHAEQEGGPGSRTRRKTGLTPVALTAKYRSVGGGSVQFENRFMRVAPVRIRHDA